MQLAIVFKFIGLWLILFSFSQLPPVIVDQIYQQQQSSIFLLSFAITFLLGIGIFYPFRKNKHILRVRESILLVVSFWFILSLIATIPFMLSLEMSFIDSFFESMSGLSTTGATVIDNLNTLPKAILYYRQQLQWFGGMGIIVLVVAILPVFGMSNVGLFHAEASSISQDRITPKLAQTAKMLWIIYLVLTFICFIAYMLAGMGAFDALAHSFSTIAIGGFSTYDASIAYFNSPAIEMVAAIFMFIAAINFSLHLIFLHKKSLTTYIKDSEFKTYVFFLVVVSVISVIVLNNNGYYDDLLTTIRHGIFQVISIATTTGFASQNFSSWPLVLPVLLIFASFVGGCVGSTGGGIKVVRILLMFKLGAREIKKLIHPAAQINIKLNGRSMASRTLISVWGFLALYVMSFVFIMILLMFSGLDQITSFSATVATMNNLGPGLGDVAQNYKNINDFAKVVLSFAMLLGRLEILTLLAIFHRAFWRF